MVSEEAAEAVDVIARAQLWQGTGFGSCALTADAFLLNWIPASVALELRGADVVLLSAVVHPEPAELRPGSETMSAVHHFG